MQMIRLLRCTRQENIFLIAEAPNTVELPSRIEVKFSFHKGDPSGPGWSLQRATIEQMPRRLV